MIKIEFEFDTEYGIFRDALYLPDDHTHTQTEIDSMKKQRVDDWIAVVSAPLDTTNTIEISGETYTRLDGTPPSGATLLEVSGVWYFKV